MFRNLTDLTGSLFDELWRWDRDWARDPFFADTPWVSGVRSVSRGTYPPINVGVSPDSVDVYLFAAGLDPESLDVSLRQNLLQVSGQRRVDAEPDSAYYRRERFAGSFKRVVTLPTDVDPDNVDASYRNGVLHVKVGRSESARPRQIPVH